MLILYHATSYPWKISLWSRYAPRHQFPNLLQGDVAEEEKIISNNNKHEHANQVQRNYEVDHYAYIVRDGNCRKLEEDILGPFRIKKVHNNRSIIIKIVIVNELINIRHITPHFEDPPTWALVFSHWSFRLIGLFCSPYMLSCIGFESSWILQHQLGRRLQTLFESIEHLRGHFFIYLKIQLTSHTIVIFIL